jgi:uncharacterized damage-inducible protein DinB
MMQRPLMFRSRFVLPLLTVACAASAAPTPVFAQAASAPAAAAAGSPAEQLAADLARDWASQKTRMVDLAEAMPPEKYTFKATEAQRTYGEQLAHLAEAHVAMFKGVDASGGVTAPVISKDHTKPEVVKSIAAAYDYGTAVLKANGGQLLDRVKDLPRARTVWQAMGNAQNHYGQLVVYLRLNGIVPPASRPKPTPTK